MMHTTTARTRTTFLLALSLVTWTAPAIVAGDPLSLQECIDLAAKQNLGFLNDRQGLESSRALLRQAQSKFELNAVANFTAPEFRDRRDLFETETALARFREENTTMTYSGSLQLSQRIRHLGLISIVSSGRRQDFSSNRRQDFLDVTGDIQFNYRHDILTTPQDELDLKRAELGLVTGRANFERRELILEADVTAAYYDLVQSIRQLEIQEQRLEQSRSSLDLAQRKFEIGLIAEVEALQLSVAKLRAEANVAQAETDIERRRDILRDLLGLEVTEPLRVVTAVGYEVVHIDESRALALGLARRTDMLEAEILTQIRELNLKETRQRNGLTAVLRATVGLLGRGDELADVSSNFERNLVTARIDIQLPLLDSGQRRSQERLAEINLERSQLSREIQRKDVTRQIRDAVRNVKEAERQIELLQAARQFAERTFEVEQSRFELGLADSQDLLISQTALTAARLDALDAVLNYQRRLKNLHLATMANLTELASTPTE